MTDTAILILILYAVSCVLAFLLLVDDWRRRWDVTTCDAAGFALVASLGPIALPAVAIIWLTGFELPTSSCRILWKCKDVPERAEGLALRAEKLKEQAGRGLR